MLQELCDLYAASVTAHHDGSKTIGLKSGEGALVAEPEPLRTLALDRDIVERAGGRIEFFGLRHRWMNRLIEHLLKAEQPLIEGKKIERSEINPIEVRGTDPLAVEDMREAIEDYDEAFQVNVLITHQVRRGDEELPPVIHLFTVLLTEDRVVSTDEVLNAKLNLLSFESAEAPEDTLDRIQSTAMTKAGEELERLVNEINLENQRDVEIRYDFQGGRREPEEKDLMEEARDLRERILPSLRQGRPVAGYNMM